MNEENQDNDVSSQPTNPITIGDYLLDLSKEKDITIKQISQQTRISINVLNNLSQDELNKLPSKTYVKGFIRTICKLLHADVNEAMLILDYTYEIINPSPVKKNEPAKKNTVKLPPIKIGRNKPQSGGEKPEYPIQAIGFGIGFVCLILVIWGIVKLSEPEKKVATSTTETKVEPIKKEADKIVEALSQIESTEVKKETETEKKPEEVKEVVKEEKKEEVLPEPVKEVKKAKVEKLKNDIKFNYIKNPLFTFDKSLTPDEYDLYLPINYRKKLKAGIENVVVNASDGSTWITYKIDDQPVKKRILNEGNILHLYGEDIRIFFGNVFATKVFYNNKLIKTPTRTGVKTLIFPIASQSKYPLPIFIYSDKTGEAIPSDVYLEQHPDQKPN